MSWWFTREAICLNDLLYVLSHPELEHGSILAEAEGTIEMIPLIPMIPKQTETC